MAAQRRPSEEGAMWRQNRWADNDRVGVTPHVACPCHSAYSQNHPRRALVCHGPDGRVLTDMAAVDYHGCVKGKDGGGDDAAHADEQGFHGAVSDDEGHEGHRRKSADAQAEQKE